MPVQLDIKRAAFFRVGHLVRHLQLLCRCIGDQAVGQQCLVAVEKLVLGDVEIVITAETIVFQRIQPAAKLAFDHDRVQSCRAELAVKLRKFRRAHGLAQHLSDDLLLGGGKQGGIFVGGRRLADGLKEDRQQLLLLGKSEDIGPVHVLRRAVSSGDRRLDERYEFYFGGGKGHHGVP